VGGWVFDCVCEGVCGCVLRVCMFIFLVFFSIMSKENIKTSKTAHSNKSPTKNNNNNRTDTAKQQLRKQKTDLDLP
jgi:hypothetical protein